VGQLQYLFPCKPNTIKPSSKYFDELDKDPEWLAEVKKNGWRCCVYSNGKIELWTRHHTPITKPVPRLREVLSKLVPKGMVPDGEILDHRSATSPGRLYLFDLLYYKFKLITTLPLSERRKILEDNITPVPGVVEIAHQVMVGKKHLFNSLQANEDEGIVMKRINSPYIASINSCQQNPFWLKVRR